MGAVEILGLAASLSLLAGWRLYAAVLAAGLAVRFAGVDLPEQLQGLHVLGHGAVLVIAAVGAVAEFFADKVPWLDSAWDTVHTLVRPVGGALLAFAVVNPSDPLWGVLVFLAGGGAALASHTAKAGTRAVINASPEPVTNILASLAEDGLTAAGLWLLAVHPEWAAVLAAVMLLTCGLLIWLAWRIIGPMLRRLTGRAAS